MPWTGWTAVCSWNACPRTAPKRSGPVGSKGSPGTLAPISPSTSECCGASTPPQIGAASRSWPGLTDPAFVAPADQARDPGPGLLHDHDAVVAGLSSTWSSGQVEEQVTRGKLIRRAGYERAKLDLLRARILLRSQRFPPLPLSSWPSSAPQPSIRPRPASARRSHRVRPGTQGECPPAKPPRSRHRSP